MKKMILLLLLLPLLSIFSLLFLLLSAIINNFSSLAAFLILPLISLLVYFVNALWLKPTIIMRLKLTRQGIKGPKPHFMYGNVPQMQKIQSAAVESGSCNHGEIIAHDYTCALFPYFEQWRKQYGLVYTYSTGNKQHLYITKAELVKEMNQSGLGKPSYITKRLAPLLGNGILRSNGHLWAQQRKIVAPEFFMDKVKGMLGLMLESTQPLIKKWEESIESQGGKIAEIRIDQDFRGVSADVISRTCFGTSYSKGKLIFSKLRTLQHTFSSGGFLFTLPTFGFLARKNHKEIKNLEKEIDTLIWDAVKERQRECLEKSSSEKDLLQMLLEGAMNDECLGAESSKSFIVDNCKNIYFAGHEATAVAASWSIMLLALHPEWQSHIREEMSQVSNNGILDSDSLSKMKTVTMVIQEALRLYPPAAFVSREAFAETKIGNIKIPKGVCIWTLIPTLHRDPDNWGLDSNEFKPERFANGVSNACKIPQAYVPFGLGPRLCLGRNFAMVQLKVVLSLIISKFKFSLSPNYKHSPHYKMIVEPGNGVNILIQKI